MERNNLTRRDFSSRVVVAAGAGLVWLSPIAGLVAASTRLPRRREWRGLLGERFLVTLDPAYRQAGSFEPTEGDPTTLVLEEATVREYVGDIDRPSHLRPAATSLLFSSPAGESLEGATYAVSHAGMGTVHLLLQPVVGRGGTTLYEAILN